MLLVKKNGVAISYQHPYKLYNAKWYIDTCHFNIVDCTYYYTVLIFINSSRDSLDAKIIISGLSFIIKNIDPSFTFSSLN